MKYWSLLILMISHHHTSALFFIPSFSDLQEIAGFAYDIYGKFNEAYDLYGTYTADISLDSILAEVKDISNQVNQLGNRLEQKIDDAVRILLRRLPLTAKVDSSLYDLHNYIVRVDTLYEDFLFYISKKEHFNNHTMQRFTDTVTSPRSNDLRDTLSKIHRLIVPGRTSDIRRGLFLLLNKQTKISHRELCDTGETPQLQLYQLYATIMVTEIRGFIMSSFSYVALKTFLGVPFTGELEKAQQLFVKRAKDYMVAVKRAMKRTPRDIRRCDPPIHKRNNTFLEFVGFIQGYIANEQKLNNGSSCSYTCETVPQPTKQYDCHRTKPYWCPLHKCAGQVMNCTYGGGGKWDICEYDRKMPRRFGWFKDGNDIIQGEKDKCTGGYPIKPVAFLQGAYSCDYCMCICVADNARSVARRIISLRPQVSDISKNMVVTGVRFIDKDDMIHVQIKQGKLQPEGRIDEENGGWKILETFKFDDWKTAQEGTEIILRDRFANTDERIPGSQFDRMGYGRDFAVLQWHQRQINLDDLYAPMNHVVTGVRFKQPKEPARKASQPIQLAIQVTPFNYTSGILSPPSEDPLWVTADNMEDPPQEYSSNRTEFDLDGKNGNPLKSLVNDPDSSPNTYVKLRASGFKEDAAQSTIPFLDSQPVHGEPDFALQGIGLFHKGDKKFGGFLAFKVFSLDYSKYLNDSVTDNLIVKSRK